ncbi:MAG: ATP-binding protein [Fibrobacterales bacterium]
MIFRSAHTIQRTLIKIILSVTLFSILALSAFYSITSFITSKYNLANNAQLQVHLISEYLITPLDFGYTDEVTDVIYKLKEVPNISDAIVYNTHGAIISAYHRGGAFEPIIPDYDNRTIVFDKEWLHLFYKITYNGEYKGQLYFRVTTAEIYSEIISHIFTTLMVCVVVIAIAYAMAKSTQGIISQPIIRLAGVTSQVSETGDYSMNLEHNYSGEIGMLYDGFLEMLNQINVRSKERDNAEIELKQFQNILANTIDSMPSIIIGVNAHEEITLWNNQAEIVLGINASVAYGNNCTLVLAKYFPDLTLIKNGIIKNEIQTLRVRSEREEGTVIEDVTVFPLIGEGASGAVIRIDDVSEKVKMDETLVQSEKMLSVGGLAAGMAHELNNPLGGIIQGIINLKNRLTNFDLTKNKEIAKKLQLNPQSLIQYLDERKILRILNDIDSSGKRAAEIISNMLDFSRKDTHEKTENDISELIDSIILIASTDFDINNNYDFKSIEIVREYSSSIQPIICERSLIQQVVLNIFRNGAHAMFENLNTLNEQGRMNRPPRFIIRLNNDTDNNLEISIEDNGPGMPENVRKRIFEPFFTTKSVGIGTGLGLSVSYFIIRDNHGGDLVVDSVEGEKTTFKIILPYTTHTKV